jgi:hypothetical protein
VGRTDPEALEDYIREKMDIDDFVRIFERARDLRDFRDALIDELIRRVGERPGFRMALESEQMNDRYQSIIDDAAKEYADRVLREVDEAIEAGRLDEAETRLTELDEKLEMASEPIKADYADEIAGRIERIEEARARPKRRRRRRREVYPPGYRPRGRRRRRRT